MKNHTKKQSKKPSKSDPSDDDSTREDTAQLKSDACTSIELFGKVKFFRQNLDEIIHAIILSDGVEVISHLKKVPKLQKTLHRAMKFGSWPINM